MNGLTFAYIRVSTKDQNEGRQIKIAKNYSPKL